MNPDIYAVPEHARSAWHLLQQQLAEHGPTPCAGRSRDDWTGSASQQARAAVRCLDCPVIEACAAYADVAAEHHSTWGGRSATQRALSQEAPR